MTVNILFLIGILCALYFYLVHLRDYMFNDKLPRNVGRFSYSIGCSIKINDLTFSSPLCTLNLYDEVIEIKYLWSRIVIKLIDLNAMYIDSNNQLILKQNNLPYTITIITGDVIRLKDKFGEEFSKSGISFFSEPLY